MKICIVTHEYPRETVDGGASTYSVNLARALVNRGHSVHVVALGVGGNSMREQEGVTVHRVVPRSLYPKKGSLKEFLRRLEYSYAVREKLFELVGTGAVEIIENHLMGADVFLFSLQPVAPIVTHLSTTHAKVAGCQDWTPNSDLSLSAWMEDEVIGRSNHLISSTRVQAEAAVRQHPIGKEKVSVIPIGMPAVKAPRSPASSSKRRQPPQILFVGRLERRKGVHTLIQAIPKVLSRVPNAAFSLMGADTYTGSAELAMEGSSHTSFKQKLLRDLPERFWPQVHFLGYCEDRVRRQMMSACDLFVAPSVYESFGIVYLEAMLYSKPVVGCRTGGVSEVVRHNENGLLVPPERPNALAGAILKLLKDSRLRRRLGAGGRRLAESRFSLDQMVDGTLEVYRKVLRHA